MLMSELISALRNDGVMARHWHIRHLIAAGAVKSPRRDGSGRFRFTANDLKAIRSRLAHRATNVARKYCGSGVESR